MAVIKTDAFLILFPVKGHFLKRYFELPSTNLHDYGKNIDYWSRWSDWL
jgi:hypothetical protein